MRTVNCFRWLSLFTCLGVAVAQAPSRVDGIWLGTLGGKLRIQVQVKTDPAGKESCSLDSLDQGVMGLPCENVQVRRESFFVRSSEGARALVGNAERERQ